MAEVDPAALFAGTAYYYARYRPPYPEAVLAAIATEFGVAEDTRVLDLGTGTGQVAIPLAARCREVVATDISAAMLAEGRQAAARAGIANIRWLELAAEAVTPALGRFGLVTIGQAFHWMDRDAVLRRVGPLLESGGGIALLGMTTIWGAPEPWAQGVMAVIRRWLGPERRAGAGVHTATSAHNHRPFEEVLADGGFTRVTTRAWPVVHVWSLDEVVGYLYSTSYCSPALFGDRLAAFEADLRRELLTIEPAGRFGQAITYSAFLAHRE